MNLSVIIPVYNEVESIQVILKRVQDTKLVHEIIVVDDGSKDGTRDVLATLDGKNGVRVILHERNKGKGAAVRTGMAAALGDVLLIQDADLEYDPRDYPQLLEPITEGLADVVYGSRFSGTYKDMSTLHYFGNKLLTLVTNIFFGVLLTDMETCYKLIPGDFARKIDIKSNRFDFEPEITAKILKSGLKIVEVPISYSGRLHSEGKKITWRDGIVAVVALARFKFFD